VIYAHGAKLGGSVVKQRLLARLAAVGFIDHYFNPHRAGGRKQSFYDLPGHGFEQGRVGYGGYRLKS
jgi:hypothetical protein